MSERILIEEAKRRRKVFESLDNWLEVIRAVVRKMDAGAGVYLFGSVAESKHTYSSDIDVLVATRMKPESVIAELWRSGVTSPFEIHVFPPERLQVYERRGKLVKLG